MQAASHGAASAAIPPSAERTIAIIGAGFCGTTVAINLLRQATSAASSSGLRIVLIDPRPEIGAGVAYSTRDYPYPLNVAAGQMSLDSARRGDFLEFAHSQGIHASPGDYLPRQVYGEYLRVRSCRSSRPSPTAIVTFATRGASAAARDWEATAVPELREHAASLARSLMLRIAIEAGRQNC